MSPRRHRIRATVKWLHLWLGLTLGTVFALVALSGTVLVYQRELLLAMHPELRRHALPTMAQQGAALARIAGEWGPRGLGSLDLPSAALPVWQGFFPHNERRYFDAASGELLLVRRPDNDAVMWLRDLHTHLLAGETGEQVLGVVGLVCLFLLLSGLYLWWPRLRMLRQSLRWYSGPPTRRWFSWHRSSGALLLPPLLLVTATGVAMVYGESVRGALRWGFGDGPEPAPPSALVERAQPTDWARVLQAAQGSLPGSELRRVALPKPGNALVSIRMRADGEWHPNGRSVAWMDPYRAAPLQVRDATAQGMGARIDEAMYPLHGGFVGGSVWKLCVALMGVLPAFLLVTGFLFWRARRR